MYSTSSACHVLYFEKQRRALHDLNSINKYLAARSPPLFMFSSTLFISFSFLYNGRKNLFHPVIFCLLSFQSNTQIKGIVVFMHPFAWNHHSASTSGTDQFPVPCNSNSPWPHNFVKTKWREKNILYIYVKPWAMRPHSLAGVGPKEGYSVAFDNL